MISATLRLCVTLLLAIGLSVPTFAREYGDEQYTPSVGQAGKDVIWVPTPDAMVTEMLKTARVTPQDIVYDLGAGDGKIAIAAARDFGARAVGIEYKPQMADLARRNVERAGLSGRVRIVTGDIFVENFSEATVVTLYLLPSLNVKLKPTLLAMRPGTRVVSHSFDMGEWEPDSKISAGDVHGYYWVVPARVQGRWVLTLTGQGEAQLNLRQSYQKIDGDLVINGHRSKIEEGRMDGGEMRFNYQRADGKRATFTANIAGNRLSGQMRAGGERPINLHGQRP